MYETFFYHPDKGARSGLSLEELKEALLDERSLIWIDLHEIDDNDIDLLTSIFNLHSLTIEDFIMPNARPKVEKFKDYFLLVMFSLETVNGAGNIKMRAVELDCCLGRNFLVTSHERPLNFLSACKDRVNKQSPSIMHGADMLLHSIVDACVESYFPLINDFDNLVDEMSDELFREPTQDTLKKIYILKNEMMHLKRVIGPQADVIGLIARGDYEFIAPANTIYFRNIHDNLVRLNDIVGTSRDIITGAMEAYVSIVSNRLNEVMKTLTVIATIMMPLTLIASVYGMNFKYMPELGSKLGYPAVLFTMFLISVLMLIYFKRRKWL